MGPGPMTGRFGDMLVMHLFWRGLCGSELNIRGPLRFPSSAVGRTPVGVSGEGMTPTNVDVLQQGSGQWMPWGGP